MLTDISIISIPFMCLSIVSNDIMIAAFCAFIFLFTLSKPNFVNIPAIFLVATFADIYNGQIAGISFVQFMVIYLCVNRFRMLLLNCRIIFGIYFFFLMMLASESICFLLTWLFFGHSFDLYMHFERLTISVFLCSLYCLVAFLSKKMSS